MDNASYYASRIRLVLIQDVSYSFWQRLCPSGLGFMIFTFTIPFHIGSPEISAGEALLKTKEFQP